MVERVCGTRQPEDTPDSQHGRADDLHRPVQRGLSGDGGNRPAPRTERCSRTGGDTTCYRKRLGCSYLWGPRREYSGVPILARVLEMIGWDESTIVVDESRSGPHRENHRFRDDSADPFHRKHDATWRSGAPPRQGGRRPSGLAPLPPRALGSAPTACAGWWVLFWAGSRFALVGRSCSSPCLPYLSALSPASRATVRSRTGSVRPLPIKKRNALSLSHA